MCIGINPDVDAALPDFANRGTATHAFHYWGRLRWEFAFGASPAHGR